MSRCFSATPPEEGRQFQKHPLRRWCVRRKYSSSRGRWRTRWSRPRCACQASRQRSSGSRRTRSRG
eukprot:3011066-Pyramimonas_sp.AAC.1